MVKVPRLSPTCFATRQSYRFAQGVVVLSMIRRIAQILQSKPNLKNLTVRILIVSAFLMSLLAGVGAGGGAWLLVKLNDEDISIAAVEESCNKGSEVGDYKVDDPSCVEESLRAWAGGVGIALITLVFFGFVALVVFAIGAVSLRRHLKRTKLERQGTD